MDLFAEHLCATGRTLHDIYLGDIFLLWTEYKNRGVFRTWRRRKRKVFAIYLTVGSRELFLQKAPTHITDRVLNTHCTKMKFCFMDFFRKCDQIRHLSRNMINKYTFILKYVWRNKNDPDIYLQSPKCF